MNNEQYALTLFPDRPQQIEGLRQFTERVSQLHAESITELDALTQRLGLATIDVPQHVPQSEQNYLKTMIELQTLKRSLWTSLQAYQDEDMPIRLASARGGRAGTLGTSKLTSAAIALQAKAKQVKYNVKRFNSVIASLENLQRPVWVPEGLIPTNVDDTKLLRLTQDDPLWDELFGGTPWFRDLKTPDSMTAPVPAYARSKEVRDGIIAALTLERIDEQQLRLQAEAANLVNEWLHRLWKVWECRRANLNSWCYHRLDRAVYDTLTLRPSTVKFSKHSQLWTESPLVLHKLLQDTHPIAFTDMHQEVQVLQFDHSTARRVDDSLFPDGVDSCEEDGHAHESSTIDGPAQEGLSALSTDDGPAQEDTSALNQSDRSAQNLLPSVFDMISKVDGRQVQDLDSANCSSLPPVTMLLDAVDGRSSALDPVFNFYSAGIEATSNVPGARIALGSSDRFFGDTQLSGMILRSLGENRHLDPVLVRALAFLIELDLKSNPLHEVTPSTMIPNCSVLVIDWHTELSPDSIWENTVRVCANISQ
jgi:hypothetical protein